MQGAGGGEGAGWVGAPERQPGPQGNRWREASEGIKGTYRGVAAAGARGRAARGSAGADAGQMRLACDRCAARLELEVRPAVLVCLGLDQHDGVLGVGLGGLRGRLARVGNVDAGARPAAPVPAPDSGASGDARGDHSAKEARAAPSWQGRKRFHGSPDGPERTLSLSFWSAASAAQPGSEFRQRWHAAARSQLGGLEKVMGAFCAPFCDSGEWGDTAC